jgi:hypothetical protein
VHTNRLDQYFQMFLSRCISCNTNSCIQWIEIEECVTHQIITKTNFIIQIKQSENV